MPEFDGFDLLKWVREQEPLQKLPFILLSSVQASTEKERAAQLGATAFFEKFPPLHVFAELLGGMVQS